MILPNVSYKRAYSLLCLSICWGGIGGLFFLIVLKPTVLRILLFCEGYRIPIPKQIELAYECRAMLSTYWGVVVGITLLLALLEFTRLKRTRIIVYLFLSILCWALLALFNFILSSASDLLGIEDAKDAKLRHIGIYLTIVNINDRIPPQWSDRIRRLAFSLRNIAPEERNFPKWLELTVDSYIVTPKSGLQEVAIQGTVFGYHKIKDFFYKKFDVEKYFSVIVTLPEGWGVDTSTLTWESEFLYWKLLEAMNQAVGGFCKEKKHNFNGILKLSKGKASSAIHSLHYRVIYSLYCHTAKRDLLSVSLGPGIWSPSVGTESSKKPLLVSSNKLSGIIKADDHEVTSVCNPPYEEFKPFKGNFKALAISPLGLYALGVTTKDEIILWHIIEGKMIYSFKVPYCVSKIQFGPYGRWALVVNEKNEIYAWDLYRGYAESCFLIDTFKGNLHALVSCVYKGQIRIYAAGENDNIFIYDLTEKKQVGILQGHSGIIYDLDLSIDSRYLLSGGSDQTARVWDVSTGKLVATFPTPAPVRSVIFTDLYKIYEIDVLKEYLLVVGLEDGHILSLER